MSSINKLLEVMAQLRNPQSGCTWDLQQDFKSIAPYTIEEAYEVAEAIANDDLGALRDELGDLLFQVVFHARIAEEQGAFNFADVADSINQKMHRRHPHIFGSEEERSAGQQEGSWEAIKRLERVEKTSSNSALEGVAMALPALKRAQKLGKLAASTGFDWPDSAGARAKIDEELAELVEAEAAGTAADIEEELGDVLFAVVNLARHLKVDAEKALQESNRKFEDRFRLMESGLREDARNFESMSIDAMEEVWQKAKEMLRT